LRIFLSYSSTQRSLAQQVRAALEGEGHSVFFDRDALPSGEPYNKRIRDGVDACELFVFLACADSLDPGSYTLTELALVEQMEAGRRPAVLPVLTEDIDPRSLPALLASRTVLQPRGNIPAEIAAQVDRLQKDVDHQKPRIVAQRSGVNDWLVLFEFTGGYPEKIFYRLAEDQPWIDTGELAFSNPMTGRPLPGNSAVLRTGRHPPREIHVKYITTGMQERGPYRLPFNAVEQFLRSSRDNLRTSGTVTFGAAGGSLWASFSGIVCFKDVLSAVRYSIDDESLSRHLRFTSDPARLTMRIDADDEHSIEVPPDTRFVCVQWQFTDGTASDPVKCMVHPGE
jgi:hypothetical protein